MHLSERELRRRNADPAGVNGPRIPGGHVPAAKGAPILGLSPILGLPYISHRDVCLLPIYHGLLLNTVKPFWLHLIEVIKDVGGGGRGEIWQAMKVRACHLCPHGEGRAYKDITTCGRSWTAEQWHDWSLMYWRYITYGAFALKGLDRRYRDMWFHLHWVCRRVLLPMSSHRTSLEEYLGGTEVLLDKLRMIGHLAVEVRGNLHQGSFLQ